MNIWRKEDVIPLAIIKVLLYFAAVFAFISKALEFYSQGLYFIGNILISILLFGIVIIVIVDKSLKSNNNEEKSLT